MPYRPKYLIFRIEHLLACVLQLLQEVLGVLALAIVVIIIIVP